MRTPTVVRVVEARIPTVHGTFRLMLFEDQQDGKEHLVLQLGAWAEGESVLVRVHSECFTGDVLGSLRCDCGEQLQMAMKLLALEGRGLVLYLRQEGRGIGLREKLRAYNLQDEGYDTVEANLKLGHGADERDYAAAADILQSLGVGRVRLITNNPLKIESLEAMGITVAERIPAHAHFNAHNAAYLEAKVRRMRHLLDLGPGMAMQTAEQPDRQPREILSQRGRPYVTLSYAQSLDGSIAAAAGQPFRLSGTESMTMTHRLRAAHDAILVGIGTVLADDPRLTVRLTPGPNPRPVVLDSHLRLPPHARLLDASTEEPVLVATTPGADPERQVRLERAGATVLRLPYDEDGRVDLHALLDRLGEQGLRSVMVEGGGQVITSFLAQHLVDRLVVTFAAVLLGGLRAVGPLQPHRGDGESSAHRPRFPRLRNLQYRWLGDDLVLRGDPYWES